MIENTATRKLSQTDNERIAKAIARAGVCSRRAAEQLISAGRVTVNGAVISSPALNVTCRDTILIDDRPLPARERTRLFLYHKPRGLVTTASDPEGRPTIFGALPKELPRLISVGRLDLTTEGLLLLTNDGGLARVLELPQTGWVRRYRVRAHGRVTQSQLEALAAGLTVEGIAYGPIQATLDRGQGSNVWLTVAIREGKNREIRAIAGALALQVNRLIRVGFGPFQLGDMPAGAVLEVPPESLAEQLGPRVAAAARIEVPGPSAQLPKRGKPPRAKAAKPTRAARQPARRVSSGSSVRADKNTGRGRRTRSKRPPSKPADGR